MIKRFAIIVIALFALSQPALAGWYLLLPTSYGGDLSHVAPLSDWQHWAAFENASQCANARTKVVESARKQSANARDRALGMLITQAECVTDTDPRLAR
jgi:hypothetical protein